MKLRRRIGAVIAALSMLALSVGVASAATIVGDDTDNVLTGTPQADQIDAKGGNDTVTALAGADLVRAGEGNDTVDAGPGNDRVRGGPGVFSGRRAGLAGPHQRGAPEDRRQIALTAIRTSRRRG